MNIRDRGLRLQLVLTTTCNNTCYFCHFSKPIELSTFMSRDTLDSIYETAIKHGNCTHVTLTGGESIMHPEFNNIVLKFREMFPDIHIQVNTNFQHNLFEKLPYKVAKNINLLSITLHDQYVRDIDAFFKKVKNLKNIPDNAKQVTLMLDRISHEKVLHIYDEYSPRFNVILKYVYGEEEFLKNINEYLIHEAIHINSRTNFKYMLCNNEWVIDQDGNYYTCWDEYPKIIGNIHSIPELKSIVLCTRDGCKSALFTDKGSLGENDMVGDKIYKTPKL